MPSSYSQQLQALTRQTSTDRGNRILAAAAAACTEPELPAILAVGLLGFVLRTDGGPCGRWRTPMLTDEHLARCGRGVMHAFGSVARRAGGTLRRPSLHRIFLGAPLPEQRWRSLIAAVLCFCICSALLGRMIETGLQRGMDGGLYEVVEDAGHAIAIAISDMRFGLHRGYVGYQAIYETLERGGLTSKAFLVTALHRTYPEQLNDRALLNQAIQSALHTPVPKDVSFADRSLVSMVAAELGLVDYFKLSFRLFGFRVEAAFYLYFLLLGISAAAFILAHWRSRYALAIPILFLTAGNMIMASNFFDPVNTQSVTNPRFLSTLGLLPGLHILVLMLDRVRPTVVQIALACLQALIFEFALSIRASLLWLALLVVTIAIIQVSVALARRNDSNGSDGGSLASLGGELAANRLWPACVLLIGIWSYQSTMTMKAHPSYQLDDFLPSHLRYHNAFIGLSFDPKWNDTFGKDYYNATSDQLGFLVGALYLMDNYDVPESYYQSSLYGGPKMQLDDRMARNAYFQFIRRHPWSTVEAHYFKLKFLMSILVDKTRQALVIPTIAFLSAAAVLVAWFFTGAFSWRGIADGSSARAAQQLLVIAIPAVLFSWIPYVYAHPNYAVVGDALWTMSLALLMACSAILANLSRIVLTRARKFGWFANRGSPA
jgi:hypothetical protein